MAVRCATLHRHTTADGKKDLVMVFKDDWWNATSYAAYYRTWNVVVHDWLYTYVYKDFCEVFQPKTHFVPTMLVFFVSAVVHEFILAFTFRFFYPMLLLAFGGFGASLVFLPRDVAGSGNIIMWLLLCIGNGILTSAYSMEWYARTNCQQTLHGVVRQNQLPTDSGKILMSQSHLSPLLLLCIGNGILTSVYSMEWYARTNCQQTLHGVVRQNQLPTDAGKPLMSQSDLSPLLLLCIGNGILTSAYSMEWYARTNCQQTLVRVTITPVTLTIAVYREWYSNISLQHGVVHQNQLPTDAGPVLGFLRSPLVELSTVVIWK
uniref:Sterol O-acyltransferase n=1 Tax=Timema poppense TaxID=170557 RepID=A0A7R9H9S5_TIMPO|nr:unnamed protein product [Timema poppensis]